MRTHESPPDIAIGEQSSVVRVRFDNFDALCTARGLTNDNLRAKALGISHPHLGRIRSGHTGPGAKFIGAALGLLGCRFEDVFERRAA